MSWIVPWNGKEYDVDPAEFTGLELKQIKLHTGLTYRKLLDAIGELDGEGVCALFWTVDKRTDPDLKFGDYAGPPLRVLLQHLAGFNTAMEELGKALGIPETSGTNGSPSSPSELDGVEPNTML